MAIMGPQMYDHGFATLALAECYGMVDDKRIAPALKKCVALILQAQKSNPRHGWRYSPDAKDRRQYCIWLPTGCPASST